MKTIIKETVKPRQLKQYYSEQERLQRWARIAQIRARLNTSCGLTKTPSSPS